MAAENVWENASPARSVSVPVGEIARVGCVTVTVTVAGVEVPLALVAV